MEELIADLLKWLHGVERDNTQEDFALCGPSSAGA